MAVAVEGEDEVTFLRVKVRRGRNCGLPKGTLEVTQRLQLPGVQLPTQLSFSPSGRLWVAGRPPADNAESRCTALAAAENIQHETRPADASEEVTSQTFAACVFTKNPVVSCCSGFN